MNNSCTSITSHISFGWPVASVCVKVKLVLDKSLYLSAGFTSVAFDWKSVYPETL